jgi:hypothetical protein
MGKEGYVILLKTFFSKCTPQAIEYLDIHVNDWIAKENVKIVNANQSFGVVEGKGGQKEPQLFINIWYEKAGA